MGVDFPGKKSRRIEHDLITPGKTMTRFVAALELAELVFRWWVFLTHEKAKKSFAISHSAEFFLGEVELRADLGSILHFVLTVYLCPLYCVPMWDFAKWWRRENVHCHAATCWYLSI